MLAYDQGTAARRGRPSGSYTNADRRPGHLAGRLPGAAAVGRRRRRDHRRRPVGQGHRDHQPVHASTRSTAPAASGRRCGPGAHDVPYEAIPAPTSTATGRRRPRRPAGSSRRQRVRYRSDDLTALLPPGQLQPRALPGQTYQAALTPGLLTAIFGALVPAGHPGRGRLRAAARRDRLVDAVRPRLLLPRRQLTPRRRNSPTALGQFFLPRRAVDPFGAITRADYDSYALPGRFGNRPGRKLNYGSQRLSRAGRRPPITDPNGNRVSAAFDALGLVDRAPPSWARPPRRLGDLLDRLRRRPGRRDAARRSSPTRSPTRPRSSAAPRAASLTTSAPTSGRPRPRSRRRRRPTRWPARRTSPTWPPRPTRARRRPPGTSTSFGYSDGFGRVDPAQGAGRARPGGRRRADGRRRAGPGPAGPSSTTRDGPVRKYEPFFSATSGFEFAAQTGVSTVLLYDPPGRRGGDAHPDNSWAKSVFGAVARAARGTATTPC